MFENKISVEKLSLIKKLLEQKIYEIEKLWTTNSSNQDDIFWEIIQKNFDFYTASKNASNWWNLWTKLQEIISIKLSQSFRNSSIKGKEIDAVIEQMLFETTMEFNNLNWANNWSYIFPVDEILIIDIIEKKPVYWANLGKPIEFESKNIEFFAEKFDLLNPGEILQAWEQSWIAPDLAAKLCDKYLLLINNTSYSINELNKYWNWEKIKPMLTKYVDEIIKIMC